MSYNLILRDSHPHITDMGMIHGHHEDTDFGEINLLYLGNRSCKETLPAKIYLVRKITCKSNNNIIGYDCFNVSDCLNLSKVISKRVILKENTYRFAQIHENGSFIIDPTPNDEYNSYSLITRKPMLMLFDIGSVKTCFSTANHDYTEMYVDASLEDDPREALTVLDKQYCLTLHNKHLNYIDNHWKENKPNQRLFILLNAIISRLIITHVGNNVTPHIGVDQLIEAELYPIEKVEYENDIYKMANYIANAPLILPYNSCTQSTFEKFERELLFVGNFIDTIPMASIAEDMENGKNRYYCSGGLKFQNAKLYFISSDNELKPGTEIIFSDGSKAMIKTEFRSNFDHEHYINYETLKGFGLAIGS